MDHYGSYEGFIEYHEARGREIPDTWDNDFIEAALLVATEWLDGVYGPSLSGEKVGGFTQTLEWPRLNAFTNTCPIYIFPQDEIPVRVINATYEAAFRQGTSPGSLSVDYTPGKYKSVTVEGAISVDYAQFSSSSDIQVQIGIIDRLMYPLLTGTGSGFSPLSGGVSRV